MVGRVKALRDSLTSAKRPKELKNLFAALLTLIAVSPRQALIVYTALEGLRVALGASEIEPV
jgi:hypothetical protein